MSGITGELVATLARVWHRFALQEGDSETLATMLAPMDKAGETVSEGVQFDMEPSDFNAALEETASPRTMS